MPQKAKKPHKGGKKKWKLTKKFVNSLKVWTPIQVNWNDAFSRRGWRSLDEVSSDVPRIQNIGLFLKADDSFLYLAAGRCTNDNAVTDHWGIPINMITGLKRLG